MALMRYVGPHDEVRLLVAGNEIGTVENGGSIVVPDELVELVEWQADHWVNANQENVEEESRAVSSYDPPAESDNENKLSGEGVS